MLTVYHLLEDLSIEGILLDDSNSLLLRALELAQQIDLGLIDLIL